MLEQGAHVVPRHDTSQVRAHGVETIVLDLALVRDDQIRSVRLRICRRTCQRACSDLMCWCEARWQQYFASVVVEISVDR